MTGIFHSSAVLEGRGIFHGKPIFHGEGIFSSAPDPIAGIPGLIMRFSASRPETSLTAAGTPALNNDPVKTIVDRMGNFNGTQSVETQQALWKTNILNGHGCWLLDAVDDGFITECDLGSAYTIIVVSNTSLGPSRRTINSRDNNCLISTSRTFAAVYSGATVVSDTSGYAGQWVIGALRVDGSNSNFRANGANITDNGTSGNPWGRVSIGYPGDNMEPAAGYLFDLPVFDRWITDEEVAIVEAELSRISGIALTPEP